MINKNNPLMYLFNFDYYQGTLLRVGDIVKFGRVPFLIKESSLEAGVKGEEVIQQEEDETLERNLTDIEYFDGYNYLQKTHTFKQVPVTVMPVNHEIRVSDTPLAIYDNSNLHLQKTMAGSQLMALVEEHDSSRNVLDRPAGSSAGGNNHDHSNLLAVEDP